MSRPVERGDGLISKMLFRILLKVCHSLFDNSMVSTSVVGLAFLLGASVT